MIVCVGIGPGDINYLTQRALGLLQQADVVGAFDSVLNIVSPVINPTAKIVTMNYKDQVERLDEIAKAHHSGKNCVVGFMGDVHFSGFQLLERVERACGHSVDTMPGISSAQVLASRARVCFDETTFVTFHRRGDLQPFKTHLLHVLADGRNAIVIPRPWDFMPREIADYLLAQGISPDHKTEVWENLTQREATWSGTLNQCTAEFSDMSIILLRALTAMDSGV
ncbi:cobalt-precorrin-7 (C(5))-methyltransferase [soil metagenome]